MSQSEEKMLAQGSAMAAPGVLTGMGMAQERQATPAEQAVWQRQRNLRASTDAVYGSLQRISQAVELAQKGEVTTLLRSDLDNAARHAGQVMKQIRAIKSQLFPKAEKTTNGAEPTTAQ